jgi:hypothetical protein
VSPTSATQGLSQPGSFPASETLDPYSPEAQSPQVIQKSGFDVQILNGDSVITEHTAPVFRLPDSWLSPMEKLFDRIEKNDREYVQRLPSLGAGQKKQGIFIDQANAGSGRTPLTAALIRGHLDIAIDLLMLEADPRVADGNGRTPEKVAGPHSIASMVLQFMIIRSQHGAPRTTASETDKKYQKLFAKVDLGSGHTLLSWAISQQHNKLAGLLIQSGADFRICNRFGRSALAEACVSGSLAIVSVILDGWPTLASDMNRHYLIAALHGAAEANRPMVMAQLLTFFRDEFRLQQSDTSEANDERPLEKITRSAQTQQDSYRFVFEGKSHSPATVEQLKRRTTDHWLLTPDESRLLELPKLLAYAQSKELPKIVEIIHAHAKLRVDD